MLDHFPICRDAHLPERVWRCLDEMRGIPQIFSGSSRNARPCHTGPTRFADDFYLYIRGADSRRTGCPGFASRQRSKTIPWPCQTPVKNAVASELTVGVMTPQFAGCLSLLFPTSASNVQRFNHRLHYNVDLARKHSPRPLSERVGGCVKVLRLVSLQNDFKFDQFVIV